MEAYNGSVSETFSDVTLLDTLAANTTVVPGTVKLTVAKDKVATAGANRPTDDEIADAEEGTLVIEEVTLESVPESESEPEAQITVEAWEGEEATVAAEEEELVLEDEEAAELETDPSDTQEASEPEEAISELVLDDVPAQAVVDELEPTSAQTPVAEPEPTIESEVASKPEAEAPIEAASIRTEATSSLSYGGSSDTYASRVAAGTSIVSEEELEPASKPAADKYLFDEDARQFIWRGVGMKMEPGTHYVVEFDAKATDAVVAKSKVRNQVTVTGVPKSDPDDPVANISVDVEGEFGDLIETEAQKSATNVTSSDGKNRVGDTIRWSVTVKNTGLTILPELAVSDPLAEGLEYVDGTVVVDIDGVVMSNATSSYDQESRTLTVKAGELHPGCTATVTFDTVLTAEALGKQIVNVAGVGDDTPSSPLPGDGEVVEGETDGIDPLQKEVQKLGRARSTRRSWSTRSPCTTPTRPATPGQT